MKKVLITAFGLSLATAFVSCGGAHGDDPGHAYMPDMYYSRAYEAYRYNNPGGEYDSLNARGIHYNGLTVPGSVARGDALPYHLTEDSAGMKAADALVNPLEGSATAASLARESERLYLVNCGICHGTALDGNGPLYKGGEGPYPAKPQVLNDANAKGWTNGHIYYVITYGKGQMGSYASQLRPEQRWMVVNYIRSKQGGGKSDSTAMAAGAGATQPATQSSVQKQAENEAKK